MAKEKDESTRAFIAIEIDQSIRNGLSTLAHHLELKGVRPVPADQIHITMAFLGNIDGDSVKKIGVMLSAMERSEFEVSLMGIGTFSTKRPSVIFAKVLDGAEELAPMSSYINDALKSLRIDVEDRKLSAHATIARVRNPGAAEIDKINGFVAAHSGDQFGSFTCKGIKLKGSTLTQSGPVYRDLFSSHFSP